MKTTLVFLSVLALGFAAPQPRSLADDLQEFVDLLPLEDIKATVDQHLQDDGAAIAVILYLRGPEWAELVDTIRNKPAVQDFVAYLTDAGLPVVEIIQAIHDLIANAEVGGEPDEEGSLRSLLDEVESILPVADLLALLNDKLANSPDFQELYAKVSSQKAHDLVDEVRAIPEVQRVAQRLRDMDVKVDEALALIYAFLGWGSP